mmetsp:Transcript_13890/g.23033  ORF Transcript_13890/g.23033 Transcript_13890/m.23033 type:complete len:374 (-) Transcript_13890:77-1198(-)
MRCFTALLVLVALAAIIIAGSQRVGDVHIEALRILIVSDIHDDESSILRLRTWLVGNRMLDKIDLVVCSGDLSTMPATENAARDHGVQQEYEARANRVLHALAGFDKPVYFVPGNHDPLSLFNKSEAMESAPQAVHNMHGRVSVLSPGLLLMGWGGSSDAIENGQIVWAGFPLPESDTARGHQQLFEAAQGHSSLLVLSHSGPSGVGTSIVSATEPNDLCVAGMRVHPIDAGSPALRSTLSSASAQQRIAVVLHGHAHAAVGTSRLGRVAIVNVGSLRYGGFFGIIDLKRATGGHPGTRRWQISGLLQLQLEGCGDSSSNASADLLVSLCTPSLLQRISPVWLIGVGFILLVSVGFARSLCRPNHCYHEIEDV